MDLVRDKINGIDELVLDRSQDPHRVAHIAVEAAYWLCAVDESLWKLDGYASERDADVAGRLLAGIATRGTLPRTRWSTWPSASPAPLLPALASF